MKNKFLIFLLFCFAFSNSYSQDIRANATIDTNNVLIGDQIKLKLEVTASEKLNITWSQIPDTLGSIEIISKSAIDTIKESNKFVLRQNLVLTSFDSGNFVFPQVTFMYQKKGTNDLSPVQSDSLILRFRTVAVDTSKAFKDIKPPLEEPVTFDEYIVYILVALGAISLAFAGYFLWKKYKRKGQPKLDYDPRIPPYVLALESLKQLDAEKLWQKNQVKLYYIRLTEVVRLYLERQFKIPALEMVSHEITDALKSLNINSNAIELLDSVFSISDLVKFAKLSPIPDQNTFCMNNSIEFVNITKPLTVAQDFTNEQSSDIPKKEDVK